MSGDECKTKIIHNVIIQENGIVRNHAGQIIARLVDGINFDSEYIQTKLNHEEAELQVL